MKNKKKFMKYLILSISFSVMAMQNGSDSVQDINNIYLEYPSKEKVLEGRNSFFSMMQSSAALTLRTEGRFDPKEHDLLQYVQKFRGFENIDLKVFKDLHFTDQLSNLGMLEENLIKHIISGKTIEEYNAYVLSLLNQYRNSNRAHLIQKFKRKSFVASVVYGFNLQNEEDVLDIMLIAANAEIIRYAMSDERIKELSKHVARFNEINVNVLSLERLANNYSAFLLNKKEEEQNRQAEVTAKADLAFNDPVFMSELNSSLALKSSLAVESSEVTSAAAVMATEKKPNEFGGFKKGFFKGF